MNWDTLTNIIKMSNKGDENLYNYIEDNIEEVDNEQAVVAVIQVVNITEVRSNQEFFKTLYEKCCEIEIGDVKTAIRLSAIENELQHQ